MILDQIVRLRFTVSPELEMYRIEPHTEKRDVHSKNTKFASDVTLAEFQYVKIE